MTKSLEIRPMTGGDIEAVRALHRQAFGPGRFARTAFRVRESGRDDSPGFSPLCRLGLIDGRPIAAVTLTDVTVGKSGGVVLLGPLVVAPDCLGNNLGQPMLEAALSAARGAGKRAVLLVGNESYYKRFGFVPIAPGRITLPGPVDPARLLGCDLKHDDSLSTLEGPVVSATSDDSRES